MPSVRKPKKDRYGFAKAEKKWHAAWRREGVYEPSLKAPKKPFYNLMMFPYPSAEGLHIGSVRTFTGVDVYGRYQRMRGHDVFEPIGLDGFGIHSENFALKVGRHPMEHAKISEKNFYRQLDAIGNGFAWKERLETYDPEYYKWTQWVFTQLFKAGLAYRKKQAVNWCPSCKTVLADEQVEAGLCERCKSVVEKRELEQWFFRITAYAERLLQNLDHVDWTEKIKSAQRNWIGKSEGAEIEFPLTGGSEALKVFTTRPDTLFGATYLVLAPEHPFLAPVLKRGMVTNADEVEAYIKAARAKSDTDRIAESKDKSGVELKGIRAVNPATKQEIPIWIADYVLGGYGTGAIMAVPAHDERDMQFAGKHGLPVQEVVTADGGLKHSGAFDGMPAEEAKWAVAAGVGGARKVQYRLRDWLISRQRYWGPPIPMVFCEACAGQNKGERSDMPGWYAVPDKDLPVKLPYVKDFQPRGTGESPLATVRSFYETKCPACKGKARRETDVSDTFLDSAWYHLRYPSVKDKKRAWDPAATRNWFPVDMYIGGPEHSVLHLLYVRFVALAFHDLGLLGSAREFDAPPGEPFPVFRAHGLITKDGAKMSKSKGNVVNPDEYIKKYGADTMRMYLAFLAPLTQGGDFRDEGINGITRFLDRFWKFMTGPTGTGKDSPEAQRMLHRTIKKVGEDFDSLQYNTGISALMIALNELEGKEPLSREGKGILAKLIAPLAPFLAEDLWRGVLKGKTSVHKEPWPEYDERLLAADTFALVIQVNGKTRATATAPAGIAQADAERLALAEPKVQAALGGKEPKRVVYVAGRLLNIVV